MRIFDCVEREFAIADHGGQHVREFMKQLAGELNRSFLNRIFANRSFIRIFVLRQETTLLIRNQLLGSNFDRVAVGIAHEKYFGERVLRRVIRNDAGRYKLHLRCGQKHCFNTHVSR
jgi:hypothetical protein